MPTGTDAPPCIGVVLAGGRSRRMGRDKALLDWRGRPLIEHQLATLTAAGVDRTCVSGRRPTFRGVADAREQAGPVAGIAGVAGITDGEADLLIIPVDMPLLGPALLARLRTQRPQARCLRFVDHVVPMRLRLDRACRATLARLMATGDPRRRSLRALQHAVGIEHIALGADETTQLTDCNTPTEWNKATA